MKIKITLFTLVALMLFASFHLKAQETKPADF